MRKKYDQADRDLMAYLKSLSPEGFEKIKKDFSTHIDLESLVSSADVPPNSPSIRAVLSGYTDLHFGNLTPIMSVTSGLVHANHIQVLKKSVLVAFISMGVKEESLSWSSDAPFRSGSSLVWRHTFTLGSLSFEVVFSEDVNCTLTVVIDGFDTGVTVDKSSGFKKSDFTVIMRCLDS